MRTSLLRVLGWLWLAPVILLASCATSKSYRQNIMFRTENSSSVDTVRLQKALRQISQNYVIKPNDYLQVRVYTNKGERLVDPNGELRFGVPGSQSLTGNSSQAGGGGQSRGGDLGSQPAGDSEFLVQSDGVVKLPMVGYVKITGNTLLQADSLLQLRYNTFYKDAFVATRVTNSRVFVLGSPGGRVVPLYNDNMNLLEVLAAVGGIDASGGGSSGGGIRYGKAFNIRLIRGDLKNPMVQVIDLSTIDGMRRADLRMQPNDIIYIEPLRRPLREALADISPIIQVVATAISFVLLVTRL